MTPSAQEIPFNPRVLKWARDRVRLAPEDVARKISVSSERIVAWESGNASPTVRQARKLADIYDRPFLEFFAPELPQMDPTSLAPDYRFHRQVPSGLELTALEGVHSWAESQRLNAIDLYQELGESPPSFPAVLHMKIDDDPEQAASKAREIVGPPLKIQLSLKAKDRGALPGMLRTAFERVGVLVLKQSGLSRIRTRGLCLYDPILPIIVFGNESPGAQAFTLAHEFGHVVLGASAISGKPRSTRVTGRDGKRVEAWCNTFSAAFLMPRIALVSERVAPKVMVNSIPDDSLATLANRFAVSRHAMLVRLVNLGLVRPSFYWGQKRQQFLEEEDDYESFGRSPYYGSRYRNSLGDTYTGLVIEAFETGRIGALQAAEFMGIKNVKHLIDIRDNFAR